MFENDHVLRATALSGMVRAFCITDRDTVEYARKAHGTSPVVTVALGRLMSAALMMGIDMKGEEDRLTLKMEGDGPVRSLTVSARSDGKVKGFPGEPLVLIPANEKGKLDVAAAIGKGTLSVIKDIGLKEPYTGQVPLISGEIAEDLTYYFAASEQVPSSVSLGVLMEKDNTVKRSGGFILQLMPDASEDVISKLEERLGEMRPVTSCLDDGMGPEDILNELLRDMGLEILDKRPVSFQCGCSRQKIDSAIVSLGKTEIEKLISDGEPVEAVCHFCNTKYRFEPKDLKKLYEATR